MICVAESAEQAAAEICDATNIFYDMMNGWRPSGDWAMHSDLDDGEGLTAQNRGGDWFDFLVNRDIIWVGSPEDVTDNI